MTGRGEVKPGDIILMAGYAALQGTQDLLRQKRLILQKRFSTEFLRMAEKTKECLREDAGEICKEFAGGVFPIGPGGVLVDLWNFGSEYSLGIEADLREIPLRQETIEICNYLDINPYEIAGSGAFLAAADRKQAEALEERLKNSEIPVSVIGYFTSGNDRVVRNRDIRRFLTPKNYTDQRQDKLLSAQKREED